MKVIDRFNAKVKKSPGCWEWIGAKKPSGYGNFFMNGKYLGSHCASYILFKGGITTGMYVCHTCDNPSCVNPDHLFIGKPRDNTSDMVRKGRAIGICQGGEFHPMAKLNWEKSREIRDRRDAGSSLRELASFFYVSEATISLVCSGKVWSVPQS